VLAARGPDNNANGTPDWDDTKIAATNGFDLMAKGYGKGIWQRDMAKGYGKGIWQRDMAKGYGKGIWIGVEKSRI
jgi:hypothetical protein